MNNTERTFENKTKDKIYVYYREYIPSGKLSERRGRFIRPGENIKLWDISAGERYAEAGVKAGLSEVSKKVFDKKKFPELKSVKKK